MIEVCQFFCEECDALYRILAPLQESDWSRPTQFKGWTINDVMAHLYSGNLSAGLSLADPAAYIKMRNDREQAAAKEGLSPLALQHRSLDGLRNQALMDQWHAHYPSLAAEFAQADPKKRVPWAKLHMSARSSISARLMETWAHAQEIYDLLGKERSHTDRIRPIVVLGINTFGWSFSNRGIAVPGVRPHMRLISPSGAPWEWPATGDAAEEECIEGSAAEFCQVVAQTRNVADTRLKVTGVTARQWMSIAQCFAGPYRDPPAPGSRFKARKRVR